MLVGQGKRTKKRRPSLTKMKIKLPIKGKTRELSRKNHVQVRSQLVARRNSALD